MPCADRANQPSMAGAGSSLRWHAGGRPLVLRTPRTVMQRRILVKVLAATAFAAGAGFCFQQRALLGAAFASNPMAGDASSLARGAAIWSSRCEVCHGKEGRGDGPAAAGLPERPDDLSRIAAPPVFPDGVLAYRIAHGGEVMPAWERVLSEKEIWDLVGFIRALRK